MSDDEKDGVEPARNPASFRPPTDIEYERWLRAYLARPDAPVRVLAQIVSTRKERLLYAISTGWPGYPSLRDRLLTQDAASRRAVEGVIVEVQARAVAAVAPLIADSWVSAARRHLQPLQDVSEAITTIAAELRIASKEATFVGFRKAPVVDDDGDQVYDPDGRPLTRLEPFVDAESIARATARLAAAAKDHAILNKALLDSLSPVRDAALDFSDAPPEVLEYLRKKGA